MCVRCRTRGASTRRSAHSSRRAVLRCAHSSLWRLRVGPLSDARARAAGCRRRAGSHGAGAPRLAVSNGRDPQAAARCARALAQLDPQARAHCALSTCSTRLSLSLSLSLCARGVSCQGSACVSRVCGARSRGGTARARVCETGRARSEAQSQRGRDPLYTVHR